jgi:rhodanese-related sulfurtransferase
VAVRATLKELAFPEAVRLVDEGAAFVDLRPLDDYLDVHIAGSLELLYEAGPGMAARARDCLPLELPLVLLGDATVDSVHAAASLRGKGFTVLGLADDALNQWASERGPLASTEVRRGDNPPAPTVLDVGDPGAKRVDGSLRIPIERLWRRVEDVPKGQRIAIAGGYGVRAALAVGMLERAGIAEVVFWKSMMRARC